VSRDLIRCGNGSIFCKPVDLYDGVESSHPRTPFMCVLSDSDSEVERPSGDVNKWAWRHPEPKRKKRVTSTATTGEDIRWRLYLIRMRMAYSTWREFLVWSPPACFVCTNYAENSIVRFSYTKEDHSQYLLRHYYLPPRRPPLSTRSRGRTTTRNRG